MKRTITGLMIVSALGVGAVGCSEENESEWEQAGEEVGEAIEDTGERVGRGAEAAVDEARDDDGHTDHEHEEVRTN